MSRSPTEDHELWLEYYAPCMGFADTDRNRAAVHEAGHALVAASRGVGVTTIKLYGSDGAGGTILRGNPSELDLVWIWYGGPFAEETVFGKWTPMARPTGLDDLLFAHRLCRQIGINDITGITNRVEAYLREQQVRLELIAARLLAADTVQGAELAELLREEAPPPSRTHPARDGEHGLVEVEVSDVARAAHRRLC